jgi:hypothetical protein
MKCGTALLSVYFIASGIFYALKSNVGDITSKINQDILQVDASSPLGKIILQADSALFIMCGLFLLLGKINFSKIACFLLTVTTIYAIDNPIKAELDYQLKKILFAMIQTVILVCVLTTNEETKKQKTQ